MNKKLKKYLSLLLSLTILLGCFSIGFTAHGADEIEINAENFPDPLFMEIVKQFDTNLPEPDGWLSASERNRSVIALSGFVEDGKSIKTLKGIEFFADSLKVLRCGGIGLEELDVSALYNLTTLSCEGNQLTSLDVSNNSKLVTLRCMSNELETLTLGDIASIETLHCYANSLTSIDVSNLSELVDFRCDQNELTSLDLAFNTRLQEFTCASNHLTSLDLRYNTSLGAVVSPSIGEQTATAVAKINGDKISVPFFFDDENAVAFTSLDTEENKGYYAGEFTAYDVNDLKNGIDYEYSVGLPDSQNMQVHIDVTVDFYQVDFYADEDKQEHLGKSFVAANGSAAAPDLPAAPQCKAFDCWSEDVNNVTDNMQVYIIWKDDHAYALSDFKNGIATITCIECGDSYQVVFEDCINSTPTDSNYCEYLDVVSDGYINAKDYSRLIKMF